MYGFNSLQAQAIIVSVDYHDFLSLTLEANAHHFESLIVATTPQDKKTQSIVSSVPNATCHVTEVFYEKRCSFNKGAAIEECLGLTSRLGWFVLMDADIIMPKEISPAGTCLPISSLCFFAYLKTKNIANIETTTDEKKIEKLVHINFGTYQPLIVKYEISLKLIAFSGNGNSLNAP